MTDENISLAQVSSLSAEVRYPIAFADLEYAVLDTGGQPTLGRTSVRLVLTEEEAHKIGEHFLKLSATLREIGGSKQ